MRRSFDGLGGEPWTRRTWCSDISPGRGVMIRRREWSTSPITSWPRQEIVFGEGVAVGDLIELVAAGDVLHRPVRLGRLCECDPRRRDIGLTQAPIGRVLVTSVETSMNSAASAGAATADNADPRISQRISFSLCLSVTTKVPRPIAIGTRPAPGRLPRTACVLGGATRYHQHRHAALPEMAC